MEQQANNTFKHFTVHSTRVEDGRQHIILTGHENNQTYRLAYHENKGDLFIHNDEQNMTAKYKLDTGWSIPPEDRNLSPDIKVGTFTMLEISTSEKGKSVDVAPSIFRVDSDKSKTNRGDKKRAKAGRQFYGSPVMRELFKEINTVLALPKQDKFKTKFNHRISL